MRTTVKITKMLMMGLAVREDEHQPLFPPSTPTPPQNDHAENYGATNNLYPANEVNPSSIAPNNNSSNENRQNWWDWIKSKTASTVDYVTGASLTPPPTNGSGSTSPPSNPTNNSANRTVTHKRVLFNGNEPPTWNDLQNQEKKSLLEHDQNWWDWLVEQVKSATHSVVSNVTDPDNWKSAGKATWNGVKKTGGFAWYVVTDNLYAAGRGLKALKDYIKAHPIYFVIALIISLTNAAFALTSPSKKSLESITKNLETLKAWWKSLYNKDGSNPISKILNYILSIGSSLDALGVNSFLTARFLPKAEQTFRGKKPTRHSKKEKLSKKLGHMVYNLLVFFWPGLFAIGAGALGYASFELVIALAVFFFFTNGLNGWLSRHFGIAGMLQWLLNLDKRELAELAGRVSENNKEELQLLWEKVRDLVTDLLRNPDGKPLDHILSPKELVKAFNDRHTTNYELPEEYEEENIVKSDASVPVASVDDNSLLIISNVRNNNPEPAEVNEEVVVDEAALIAAQNNGHTAVTITDKFSNSLTELELEAAAMLMALIAQHQEIKFESNTRYQIFIDSAKFIVDRVVVGLTTACAGFYAYDQRGRDGLLIAASMGQGLTGEYGNFHKEDPNEKIPKWGQWLMGAGSGSASFTYYLYAIPNFRQMCIDLYNYAKENAAPHVITTIIGIAGAAAWSGNTNEGIMRGVATNKYPLLHIPENSDLANFLIQDMRIAAIMLNFIIMGGIFLNAKINQPRADETQLADFQKRVIKTEVYDDGDKAEVLKYSISYLRKHSLLKDDPYARAEAGNSNSKTNPVIRRKNRGCGDC